jgi:hypothetical protein
MRSKSTGTKAWEFHHLGNKGSEDSKWQASYSDYSPDEQPQKCLRALGVRGALQEQAGVEAEGTEGNWHFLATCPEPDIRPEAPISHSSSYNKTYQMVMLIVTLQWRGEIRDSICHTHGGPAGSAWTLVWP